MTDAIDTTGIDVASTHTGRLRARVDGVLRVVVHVVVVLADVLAFNQLATQSPTDGILQLTVVGVGFAGALEALRRLAFAATRFDRLLGIPLAALSALALVGWRAQWPVGVGVVCCGLTAVLVAVLGVRALSATARDPEASQFSAIVTVAQAMILAWFAVLAGVSAGGVLFG